jgi:hypothetical protein
MASQEIKNWHLGEKEVQKFCARGKGGFDFITERGYGR